METRAAATPLVYEDFVPSYKLVRDEGIDTIIIELPEFQKEQIGVQLESFGKLSVSGERPLADNRRSRFRNTFEVPKECSEIGTRFENGHLYVKVLPKLNIETSMEADIKIKETRVKDPAQEPEESQKSSTGKDDMIPKATSTPSVKPNGVPQKQQDEKGSELTDTRKDAEKPREKERDQTEEKKAKDRVDVIVSVPVNVFVVIMVLLMIMLYFTSKD